MFERQLIFLEVVSSTGIVNPVNKLYSLAYEVQQTFFVPAKKKNMNKWKHDTSFLLTKYYSYWNVFYLVKMPNLSLVSIWSLRSLCSLRKKSKKGSAIALKKFYLSDRCRCNRRKVVSIMIAMIAAIAELFFFGVIAAITAIVAIIWKPGFK